MQPVANEVVTVEVRFERPFSSLSWVCLEPVTSVPHYVFVGLTSWNNEGFTLALHRANATETSVLWRAEGR